VGTCFVQAIVNSGSFGGENYHALKIKIFLFKNIKDSLFRSIIALEAWDYAKI